MNGQYSPEKIVAIAKMLIPIMAMMAALAGWSVTEANTNAVDRRECVVAVADIGYTALEAEEACR